MSSSLQQMGTEVIAFLVAHKKMAAIALVVGILLTIVILALNAVKPKEHE